MIDVEKIVTKDLMYHILKNKVLSDLLLTAEEEDLFLFSKLLVDKITHDYFRPIIDGNLFQCQCLEWQGMETLLRGYCNNCLRDTKILIGRQPHDR